MKKFKDIPESERPREKLLRKGSDDLSDLELMAILLGSGTKGSDVMKVADRILKALDNNERSLQNPSQIGHQQLLLLTITQPVP